MLLVWWHSSELDYMMTTSVGDDTPHLHRFISLEDPESAHSSSEDSGYLPLQFLPSLASVNIPRVLLASWEAANKSDSLTEVCC